ncbi:putative phenylacetaldoxime dehydratase family protein [Metarhizium anisopliae]
MACPARTYPLRQPPNHKPPIPRWQLVWGDNISRVFTAYIGIQPLGAPKAAVDKAVKDIQSWLHEPSAFKPQAFETFGVINGDDTRDSRVWACYWDNEAHGKEGLQRLNLPSIYSALSTSEPSAIGLWSESFATPVSRLETNYTGLDYLPGIAKLPGTTTEQHDLTAYWGAARDRIPDSAHDLFEKEDALDAKPEFVQDPTGKRLVGTNYNNMVHIRSGQYWQTCGPEETASYENNLEPTLDKGLQYLWDNRDVSGAMGLRYLRNTDGSDRVLKETCGAGFFCNLRNLEDWAKSHPSHLAIYTGAIRHAKKFGDERKFRTWHEVSILKKGEASFEYVNCLPVTGVIPFLGLREIPL